MTRVSSDMFGRHSRAIAQAADQKCGSKNHRPVRRSATLVLLASIAASIAATGATSSGWALARPLHLPHVVPGHRCPTAPGARVIDGQALNGVSPAFLVGAPATPAGVISLAQSATDSFGWRSQKTPWQIARTYNGPILIRGARIDRPGSVRFAEGDGQHLRDLRFASGANYALPHHLDQWRLLPFATLFRTKGCYAFQVDGTTFSHIVTMRVV